MTPVPGGGSRETPTVDELVARGWERRREGRLDDARRALEQAVRIARETAPGTALVKALGALAHVARDQGREDEGLELLEEAVRRGRRQDDPAALAHAVRHLGDVHRAARRLEEAERCYSEALELYERCPDAPALDLANALRPMALVWEVQGKNAESVELWRKARRIYEGLGVTAGVEECDEHLAKLG